MSSQLFRVQTQPVLSDPQKISEAFFLLGWLFEMIPGVEVHILVSQSYLRSSSSLESPAYFKSKFSSQISDFRKFVKLSVEPIEKADCIVYLERSWPKSKFWINQRMRIENFLHVFNLGPVVMDLDKNSVSHHTWRAQERLFSNLNMSSENISIEKCLSVFKTQKSLLVGSGPSSRALLDKPSPPPSVNTVVCNGVVLDQELTNHLKPKFVTAIDPLYHCGPSIYCERFQESIQRLFLRYDTKWITRREFLPWIHRSIPAQFHRNIWGFQFRKGEGVHIDFQKKNWMGNINGNVLPTAMLPLGGAISDEIFLAGFDGKEPNSKESEKGNKFFWKHGAKASIENWEETMQFVNKAYFERNFEKYHKNHNVHLSRVIKMLKANGREVYRVTESFIPSLAELQVKSP